MSISALIQVILRPIRRSGGTTLVLFPLILQSCASAHVRDLTPLAVTPPIAEPTSIAVVVASEPIPDSAGFEAIELQSDIMKELLKSGFPGKVFPDINSASKAAVLNIQLTRSDPGSRSKRLLIGFGSGRAQIETKVSLELPDTGGDRTALSFATAGNSGYRPGLIVPAGAAIATANAVHFVVGGAINIATSPRDALRRPARKTARAIVTQLRQYYRSVGWSWPAQQAGAKANIKKTD